MRYFLELSYNGSAYKGWQRQAATSPTVRLSNAEREAECREPRFASAPTVQRDHAPLPRHKSCQPQTPTVQQTIEEALSKLLGEPIELTGAGRTDTGVHAARYIAHFDTRVKITADKNFDTRTQIAATDFLYHANSMLPSDIALRKITRVADDAHARFDAREREYIYYILPYKDPFRTGLAWHYSIPLDVEAMNRAAAHLLTHSDFTSFAKLGSNNRTNICRITEARWTLQKSEMSKTLEQNETTPEPQSETTPTTAPSQLASDLRGYSVSPDTPSRHSSDLQTLAAELSCPSSNFDSAAEIIKPATLVFTIRADRFLRNMVRAIVGTLVDVGRGKITPERFAEIITTKDLSLSSGGAPAHGLFLTDIRY
jgi:tRNA pseudouridine(38-40) synthase